MQRILDNKSLSHPSLFQNPQYASTFDQMSNKVPISEIDPTRMWGKRNTHLVDNDSFESYTSMDTNSTLVGGNQKTLVKDPDAFDPREIEKLKEQLNPVISNSMVNSTLPTLLMNAFFSRNNVDLLQFLVIKSVKHWSSHTIGKQNEETLLNLMQDTYTNYGRNIAEYSVSKHELVKYIRQQVNLLNDQVVNTSTPIIINELEQHLVYLKRLDQPRDFAAFARPQSSSVTGLKQYNLSRTL